MLACREVVQALTGVRVGHDLVAANPLGWKSLGDKQEFHLSLEPGKSVTSATDC